MAELVRREAIQRLGNSALTDAYTIRTTIDSRAQVAANEALRDGLIAYDQRHGYRGAEAHVDIPTHATPAELGKKLDPFHTIVGLVPGIVTDSGEKSAQVYLEDGQTVSLSLEDVAWARALSGRQPSRTPCPSVSPACSSQATSCALPAAPKRKARADGGSRRSRPRKAALIALDPEDGAIKAEVGGFSFARSKFNRAVQASRNPGSGFKPFFYAAAFEHGFTPASIVNDAPVVFADPSKPNGQWAPKNDDDKFDGPMRLREAMVQSKNLVSVRLLDAIGVRYAREYVTRFGLTLEQVPNNLSMALGTASVAPITMARGFAVFANGGYLVDPYFLDVDLRPRRHGSIQSAAGRGLPPVSATPGRRRTRADGAGCTQCRRTGCGAPQQPVADRGCASDSCRVGGTQGRTSRRASSMRALRI